MARSRIDDLLDEQDADLASLTQDEAARFLVVYTAARQRLWDRLAALQAAGQDEVQLFTRQHLMVMLAQAERGMTRLERELRRAVDDSVEKARRLGWEHLLDMIKLNEPEFRDTGSRIARGVLKRLTEERGLLVHQHSVKRYSADVLADIQRDLALGVSTGQTIPQIRDQLAATMQAREARAETIVRMELNKAYNEGHQTAGEVAHEVLDEPDEPDPLMKRAVEFLDMRNNAISRALDGQVVPIDEPFRVPVAAVQAAHEELQALRQARKLPVRRAVTGIVWPIVDGHYVGMTHPAHFNDRGRQVVTRRRWRQEEQERSSVGAVKPSADKPKPRAVVVHGQPDSEGEAMQAQEWGARLGGGEFFFPAERDRQQGIDALFRPAGSGQAVPVSLKEFSSPNRASIMRRVGRNSGKIDEKGLGPGWLLATVPHRGDDFAGFLKAGPMATPPEGFSRMMFRCSDGRLVTVDETGVMISV